MEALFSLPDPARAEALSSLALTHVGDAVFDLLVRTRLASEREATAEKLHRETGRIVNAGAQAEFARLLLPELTEGETAVYKRGRNANPHSHPKGATRQEYQIATGLEALFGWLYLNGANDRLNTLFEAMLAGEEV